MNFVGKFSAFTDGIGVLFHQIALFVTLTDENLSIQTAFMGNGAQSLALRQLTWQSISISGQETARTHRTQLYFYPPL